MFKQQHQWDTYTQWAVSVLVVLSVLWRGGKSLDMTWILTGVTCACVLLSHRSKQTNGGKPVPLFLWGSVMGFIALTVLSFVFSTTQNYGLDEVLRTGALGLILLWMIRHGDDLQDRRGFARRLLRIMALTTILACMIGFLVYAFQPVNRFVGTFFDYRFHTDYWPNAWAQYLLLMWPLVLYYIFENFTLDTNTYKSRVSFLLRIALLGIVFSCLLLSYSRGALIAFALQLGLWSGFIYYRTRPHFPIRKILPPLVVIGIASVLAFIFANSIRGTLYEVQDVSDKITLQASEGGSSVTERFAFFSQALHLGAQKPLLGWGPYSFRFAQPTQQSGVLETSDHPHNVLLKIFMERGVITLVLFTLVVGLILYRAAFRVAAEPKKMLQTMLFLGIAGLLMHNMIDFNLQFVGIALPFWLMLGILMTCLDHDALRSVGPRLSRYTEMTLAILLLLVATYEGIFLVTSSIGRHAEKRGDTEAALTWYRRSSPEIFTRDLLLSQSRLEEQEATQLGLLKEYRERNPIDYRSYRQEGDMLLFTAENPQLAIAAFTKALDGGKWNDLGITRGLIEAHQSAQQLEAIDQLKPEVDGLLIAFADAIERNAHFIALSQNVEEFIIICNRLASLYPEEAPRYQVMAAKADHHAQIERAKIQSRAPGYLW